MIDEARMEQELSPLMISSEHSALIDGQKGLYHTYGERWSRRHRCALAVQLHVLEELWDRLRNNDTGSQKADDEGSQMEVDLMSISKEAVNSAKN